MSEKDELKAAIEKAKAKTSPKPANSLADKLGDQIALWGQNIEPAFEAAVKEANADLAESSVRLRVHPWPFELVYSVAGLDKLPGLAVATDKNTSKASRLAAAVAGGAGSEALVFSRPYVEAHLDHNGAVVVTGHRYAVTRGGTFSLAQLSSERIKEIVFEFAKLVAVPMGF